MPNPKSQEPHEKRLPGGIARRHVVEVTQKHIDSALIADSSRCMVSDAVGDYFAAKGIRTSNRLTDIRLIRVTLPEKGIRAMAITPIGVALALAQWDQGIKPEPFTFRLEFNQVVKSGSRKKKKAHLEGMPPGEKTELQMDSTAKQGARAPLVIGGKTPPLAPLANDKKRKSIGMRRAFGVHGLARLLGQAVDG